jgi:hypothetical protein
MIGTTTRAKRRIKVMADGSDHTVNDEGRTCNSCEAYKVWADYRPNKGSYTEHNATCTQCLNEKATVRRRNVRRTPEQIAATFYTPVNIFLMRKWI